MTDQESDIIDLEETMMSAEGSPVTSMVYMILLEGVRRSATEIRLKRDESSTTLQYMVGNNWIDALAPPIDLYDSLIVVLRNMAQCGVGIPPSGTFRIKGLDQERNVVLSCESDDDHSIVLLSLSEDH